MLFMVLLQPAQWMKTGCSWLHGFPTFKALLEISCLWLFVQQKKSAYWGLWQCLKVLRICGQLWKGFQIGTKDGGHFYNSRTHEKVPMTWTEQEVGHFNLPWNIKRSWPQSRFKVWNQIKSPHTHTQTHFTNQHKIRWTKNHTQKKSLTHACDRRGSQPFWDNSRVYTLTTS